MAGHSLHDPLLGDWYFQHHHPVRSHDCLCRAGYVRLAPALLQFTYRDRVANACNSAFGCFILFIEVPLLLRICPTSSKFDDAIRKISTNWTRAAAYCVMSVVLFLSLLKTASSLIATAVFLALTAICYLLAAVKGQSFVGSKTLGGQGVAQMIV
jgi:hypothetical protein